MQKNQPLKDEDADVQKNIEHKYDVTDFYWDPKDSPVVVGLCTNKHFENTTFAVIGVSRQCFCEMIRCERIRHMIIFSGSTCALSWFFEHIAFIFRRVGCRMSFCAHGQWRILSPSRILLVLNLSSSLLSGEGSETKGTLVELKALTQTRNARSTQFGWASTRI